MNHWQIIIIVLLFWTKSSFSQDVDISALKSEWITEDSRAYFGEVKDVYEDSLGIIWVGIYGKGLAYYTGEEILRLPLTGEEQFSSNETIFYPNAGKLYLNGHTSVKVFDPIKQKVESSIPFKNQVGQKIENICFSNFNGEEVVLATVVSKTSSKINYQIYYSANNNPFQLLTSEVFASLGKPILHSYSKDQILLKSEHGLLIKSLSDNWTTTIDLSNETLTHLTNENIIIRNGNVLAGYLCEFIDGNQVCGSGIIDIPSEIAKENQGRLKVKITLFALPIQDRIGLVGNSLVGAHNKIIDLDNPLYVFEAPHGFSPNTIVTRDGLLFSGSLSGLSKFSNVETGFKLIPNLGNRTLLELPDGNIVGTVIKDVNTNETKIYNPILDSVYQSPLIKLAPANAYQFVKYNNYIYVSGRKINLDSGRSEVLSSIIKEFTLPPMLSLIDQKGNLWNSSWYDPTITIYDTSADSLISITQIEQLKNKTIQLSDWVQKSDGNVWIGTFGEGILILSPKGELIHQINRQKNDLINLNDGHVSGFYEDKGKNMWVAHGSGISKISPDLRKIEEFIPQQNEIDNRIFYSILPEEDDRFLWISSSKGIFRLDTETGYFMDFPLDIKMMEYEYNRISYLKSNNGTFYFGTAGTTKPVVTFHPKDVIQKYSTLNEDNAHIFISGLTFSYESDKSKSEERLGLSDMDFITIEKDVRSFELDYLLTEYRSENKIFYCHRLEGYDTDWSVPSRNNNSIRYQNLNPGRYKLHLAASLSPFDKTPTVKTIEIKVQPYWYQTILAKFIGIIIVLGLIYGIFRHNLRRQYDIQEERRVQDINNLKSKLYTNITHEFRTPLTVILGMTDNIEGHEKEKSLIKRNANGLLTLINQLLDLSKLETGKLKVETSQGDIVFYVKYLVESFYSLASSKRIQLRFESSIGEFNTNFDEKKIEYIIYNLISNAIKFTKSGGKVFVFLSYTDENLNIKVKDTGIGIPSTELPLIFDRYYQVEKTKSDNPSSGSGIGLSFTREIIELLDGNISVESEINWGSVFTVRLPLEKSSVKVEKLTTQNNLAPQIPSDNALPDQISSRLPLLLLIEDNEGVATYVKSILNGKYQIKWAINGQEGIDMAIINIPDIIISDVMMPEVDGFELTRVLKNDLRTSHIPIIMLTAKADISSKVEGITLGADAYLSKPFEKEELFARLENLISIRKKLQSHFAKGDITEDVNLPKISTKEQEFIASVNDSILINLKNANFSVQSLAKEIGMSHTQMYRKLKALTGISPVQYIRKIRLEESIKLLKENDLNISEIAYEVGFNDPNYFTRAFKKEYGVVPKDWNIISN